MWINSGDIILLGLRDYQDTKADVILKYTPDEARNLKTYGELPETGTNCINTNFRSSMCVSVGLLLLSIVSLPFLYSV